MTPSYPSKRVQRSAVLVTEGENTLDKQRCGELLRAYSNYQPFSCASRSGCPDLSCSQHDNETLHGPDLYEHLREHYFQLLSEGASPETEDGPCAPMAASDITAMQHESTAFERNDGGSKSFQFTEDGKMKLTEKGSTNPEDDSGKTTVEPEDSEILDTSGKRKRLFNDDDADNAYI